MAVINEPQYDEDTVNLGYLKRILGLSDNASINIIVTRNYGAAPNPPYNLNDTYMYNGKVYICINARKVGEFNPNDWILMADDSALNDYASNLDLNNAVGELNRRIESTATGINLEVAKKLNKTDFTHANIVLAINDTTSAALINADKINLNAANILNILAGNAINLSSNNISISSNNFSVDAQGNCVANSFSSNNATITGGTLNMPAAALTDVIIIRNRDNPNEYVTIGPRNTRFYNLDGSAYLEISNNAESYPGIRAENALGYRASLDPSAVIVTDGTNTTWVTSGYIHTPELIQTSLKKDKKNFELFTGALNIIDDIDIYKYNMKTEKDDAKKHIGFVIGDDYNYSKEITAVNEKGEEIGVDSYSMTSLCLQAIKEQKIEIELLKKELSDLKNNK